MRQSAGRYSGGRFDAAAPEVGRLYAGDSIHAVVAETLLRDTPLVDEGWRSIPFASVAGRALTVLRLLRDVELVSLHGAALAAVGQGLWLTKCDSADYPMTRAWGEALRVACPASQGFVWRGRFDEDRLCYVFYSDRMESSGFEASSTIPLDDGAGLEAVRRVLLDFRTVIDR